MASCSVWRALIEGVGLKWFRAEEEWCGAVKLALAICYLSTLKLRGCGGWGCGVRFIPCFCCSAHLTG